MFQRVLQRFKNNWFESKYLAWKVEKLHPKLFTVLFVLIANPNLSKCDEPNCLQEIVSFGNRQIDQMIDDRADMAGVLKSNDPVFLWIANSFSGEQIGERIYWNENCPTGMIGCNQGPSGGYPGFVTVTASSDITPIDKWAVVIFELFNIQNYEKFEQLTVEARLGSIDIETFANSSVALEFAAELRTNKFLHDNPFKNVSEREQLYGWLTRKETKETDYISLPVNPVASLKGYGNYEYFRKLYTALSVRPVIQLEESKLKHGESE